MNKKVVIIGAGGHAKVVADIVRSNGDTVEGFLDDSFTCEREFYGSTVIGKTADYTRYASKCCFIIAIGNGAVREKIASLTDCKWYTAIHPRAVVSDSAVIGEGSAIMANAVINADANIGKHVIVNTGSIVEHDCKIGDYSHIAPKSVVCGGTKIGKHAWLGTGSTTIHAVEVCDGVTVGAGGVVVKNIVEAGTYVGVPAKRIK